MVLTPLYLNTGHQIAVSNFFFTLSGFWFFFLAVPDIEHRVSNVLGKHSVTELYLDPEGFLRLIFSFQISFSSFLIIIVALSQMSSKIHVLKYENFKRG